MKKKNNIVNLKSEEYPFGKVLLFAIYVGSQIG